MNPRIFLLLAAIALAGCAFADPTREPAKPAEEQVWEPPKPTPPPADERVEKARRAFLELGRSISQ